MGNAESLIKAFAFSRGDVKLQAKYLVWLRQHCGIDLFNQDDVLHDPEVLRVLGLAFKKKHPRMVEETASVGLQPKLELDDAFFYARHYDSKVDVSEEKNPKNLNRYHWPPLEDFNK